MREGEVVEPVLVQPVDSDRARFFARALSPVVDTSLYNPDASDLPDAVMFLQLLGQELASDAGAVVDRWQQTESIHDRVSETPARRSRSGTLRALVGQAGIYAMHLDLRKQGPHALVGGTTGSGKSEFLQAWVLGMAAEYSPDRVTFLFVDYKGGSAFADCVHLPHCVGLVTDLSPHLVRRALTSLRAEIHYREHLFNRKKAKDLIEL
ncbi:MAG: phosphopeptide-binding protein, partial [Leucobacter sp.]|nr:phosphopeptide-binding protein [Leucobacter sp.]